MPVQSGLWQELVAASSGDSFLPVATMIFLAAVVHAFLAPRFARIAQRVEALAPRRGALLHLLGEVEAVFGLWAFVLFAALSCWPGKGWAFACRYIESGDYAGATPAASSKFIEPVFVFVIMVMAASRPVMRLASDLLERVARGLGGSPAAQWFVLLTLTPLLGSLITEPAAMTIAAMLLSARFYRLKPSRSLAYGTLALLFVNISVGGALTHFAAPPMVMVAAKWDWGLSEVFSRFGLAAISAIMISTASYGWFFRRELAALPVAPAESEAEPVIPFYVTFVHLALMVWTVVMLSGHHLDLMVGGFLAFLAFTVATPKWQEPVKLRGPLLVGFFLAGLVVLGGVQGWWIAPVLGRLDERALLGVSTFLTSFNDNAAVTYLASQVAALAQPQAEGLRHAVMAGALAGGGLTVIANAPNPAGQSILAPWFEGGISPWRLVIWAMFPTVVALGCFFWLR